MWMIRSTLSNEKWEPMRLVQTNTLVALKAYLLRYHETMLPIRITGAHNTYIDRDNKYYFWYDGYLADGPDGEPVKMTPDFTLEELEEAKRMIEGM